MLNGQNTYAQQQQQQQQQQQGGGASGALGAAKGSKQKADNDGQRRQPPPPSRRGQTMRDIGVVSAADILSESELIMLKGLKSKGAATARAPPLRPPPSALAVVGHASVSVKPSSRRTGTHAGGVRILRGSLGPSPGRQTSFLQKHRGTILLFVTAWFVYQLFISPHFIAPLVKTEPELLSVEESQEQP